MKRHENLIPLTHDHHHPLARARRLRLGRGGELFPAIQELVGDDELTGVHLAERDRTPPPRPA